MGGRDDCIKGCRIEIRGEYVDKEMFEKGLSIRRAVLGADFVDKAIATADDFNRPLQELVTQYCWGESLGTSRA